MVFWKSRPLPNGANKEKQTIIEQHETAYKQLQAEKGEADQNYRDALVRADELKKLLRQSFKKRRSATHQHRDDTAAWTERKAELEEKHVDELGRWMGQLATAYEKRRSVEKEHKQ